MSRSRVSSDVLRRALVLKDCAAARERVVVKESAYLSATKGEINDLRHSRNRIAVVFSSLDEEGVLGG